MPVIIDEDDIIPLISLIDHSRNRKIVLHGKEKK